jgi:hypothetical protein
MTTGLLKIGESVTLTFVWFNAIAAPADAPLTTLSPAPTLAMTDPSGTVTAPALVHRGTTEYYDYSFVPTAVGAWGFQARCTDALVAEEYADPLTVWVTANSLADILAKTNLIQVGGITVASPVSPATGNLTLYQGVSYIPSSGEILPEWSSTDWTPFSLTTAASVTWYVKNPSSVVSSGAVAVLSDTDVQIQTFTSAVTDTLNVGRNIYRLQVWAILDVAHGNAEVIIVDVQLTVSDDIRQ